MRQLPRALVDRHGADGPRADDALLQGTRRTPAPLARRLGFEVDGALAALGVALRKGALAADGDRTPEVCYGLGGYKVWLGSVCVDDKRLISDGSDNTVVVHDFSKSD